MSSIHPFEKSLMLDIGRKYFSPRSLMRLLDVMSSMGMTTLLLHFSEDMGVGIECPAYDFLAGRDGMLCPSRPLGTVHPDPGFLSVDELKDIIAAARRRGIDIVPSYDSPGHLNYTVKRLHEVVREKGAYSFSFEGNTYSIFYTDGRYSFAKNGVHLDYPDNTAGVYGIGSYFTLDGEVARISGTNNTDFSRGIDLGNEVGVAFIHSILDSYARLFRSLGCTAIDVGGDEFLGYGAAIKDAAVVPKWRQLAHLDAAAKRVTGMNTAVAYDIFVLYANDIYERMKKLGYESVRMWNDEFRYTSQTGWTPERDKHIQFNPGFTVQYWSSDSRFASPVSLAENGFSLIGADSSYCYYVLTDDARSTPPKQYLSVNPGSIRSEWSPYTFGRRNDGNIKDGWDLASAGQCRSLVGSMFCVWCDCPDVRSDDQIIDELTPLLSAWNEKLTASLK